MGKFKSIIISIVLISGIFFGYFIYEKNNDELIIENLKDTNNLNGIAIMVEKQGSDGDYEKTDLIPEKTDGYIFNSEKSLCYDDYGNKVNTSIKYKNNKVKINITKSFQCNLYFDYIDGDFCIDQGISSFKDCLFLTDERSYNDNFSSSTVDAAIDYINKKGSATTANMAPTVTYKEKKVNKKDENGVISTNSNFTLGSSYTFDKNTGKFTLKDYVTTLVSDEYLGYYTCGSTSSGFSACSTMYKINAYTKTENSREIIYKLTDVDIYTFNAIDSFDSEIGLYKTIDDDGDTYVYRGAVKNNYVSFGGFIWKIVRINGDGTIRMIYAGKSASEIGEDDQIGALRFNSKYWAPVYVGYTYDDSNMIYKEDNNLSQYDGISGARKIYYAKSFSCDNDTRKCQLEGEKITGIWNETYERALEEGYIYTFFSNYDSKGNFIFKLDSYVNNFSANGYFISYNSPDYKSTLKDTTDSSIKEHIDDWYENNLLNTTDDNGIKYSDYLDNNAKFCNDRQVYTGSGYLVSPRTLYNSYSRVYKREPSLLCGQNSDIYSVAKGNLDYPIALLTADEALFAGGRVSNVNDHYYLYSGLDFYTMTPNDFSPSHFRSANWVVLSSGELRNWSSDSNKTGVRPVINLKADVKITKGSGTASNPYEISLN